MGGSVVNDGESNFMESGVAGAYWSASRTTPALHTFVRWGDCTTATYAAMDAARAAAKGTAAQFRAAMPAHVQAWWDGLSSTAQTAFQATIAALYDAGAALRKV
jgi:hypothetical protein